MSSSCVPNVFLMSTLRRRSCARCFSRLLTPQTRRTNPRGRQTTDLDGKIGEDFFANYMLTARLAVERDFEKIDEAPNRRDWGSSSPLMVNAFYGPNNNGLWIPAGILQSPFFDAGNSDARNYGSIGSVLGHEMSHGFDDNGMPWQY